MTISVGPDARFSSAAEAVLPQPASTKEPASAKTTASTDSRIRDLRAEPIGNSERMGGTLRPAPDAVKVAGECRNRRRTGARIAWILPRRGAKFALTPARARR